MNTTKLPDELRKADEFDIEFMDFFEEGKPASRKPVQSSRPQTSARSGKSPQKQAGTRQGSRPAQKRPAGTPKPSGAARPSQGTPAKRPAQSTTASRQPQKRPAGTQRPTGAVRPSQGTPVKRPAQQKPVETRQGSRSAQQRPVSAKQTTRPAPKLQHPSTTAKRTARPAAPQQRPVGVQQGTRPQQRPVSTKPAAQPAKQKEKAAPKAKSRFKKGFLISWAAFTLLLIAALILLTIFLSNYEKGRPTGTILHIVGKIQKGDLSGLHLKTADGTILQDSTILYDESEIADYILQEAETADTEVAAEGEDVTEAAAQGITYRVINGESDETKKTYLVKAGDEKVLKVCIERSDKKYLFGFTGWEETESVLLADALQPASLRAQIPHDSQLSVNGNVIGRERIVSEGDRISLLSRLIDEGLIGEQPGMDTYEVPGIYFRKEVKLIDASGTPHDCAQTLDVYTGGFEASQDFIDSQHDRVIDMFEPYALYFSGERGRRALDEVMVYDSPAYNSAVSADVSWMQEHSDVDITEKKAENFKKYSDQVYSCDISFLQTIYQGDEAVRTWDTNMTWIFIWDGDDYYVADFVTRSADEG